MISIWQRPLTIRIITVLFFVVCFLLMKNVYSIWSSTKQPEIDQTILERESQKNTELKQDIENWSQEFQQEMVIREELNMQKENEIILQVPPIPSVTIQSLPTPTPSPPAWQEWADLLL